MRPELPQELEKNTKFSHFTINFVVESSFNLPKLSSKGFIACCDELGKRSVFELFFFVKHCYTTQARAKMILDYVWGVNYLQIMTRPAGIIIRPGKKRTIECNKAIVLQRTYDA